MSNEIEPEPKSMSASNSNAGDMSRTINDLNLPPIPNLQPPHSFLKPIITDVTSPYYSPDGVPQTSGDYRQRVLNWTKVKTPRQYRSFYISSVLVVGTIISVYVSNIFTLYRKEQKLNDLLKERNRLKELLAENSTNMNARPNVDKSCISSLD